MKNLIKIIVVLSVLSLICLGGVVILLMNTGFQTWAANSALSSMGAEGEIKEVSVGFSGIKLEGVKLQQDGVAIALDKAEIEFPMMSAATADVLVVNKVFAKGLVVYASDYQSVASFESEPSSKGSQKFNGLFADVLNKLDLQKTVIDVAGLIYLPERRQLDFKANNQSSGDRSKNEIEFSANILDASPRSEIGRSKIAGVVSFLEDPTSLLKTLKLHTNVSVVESTDLRLSGVSMGAEFVVEEKPEGESYTFQLLSLSKDNRGEKEALLTFKGVYDEPNQLFKGRFASRVTKAKVESLLFGLVLPDFSLQAKGAVEYDFSSESLRLDSEFNGGLSGFEEIQPELSVLGMMVFDGKVNIGLTQSDLELGDLLFNVNREGESLVKASLLKPCTLALDDLTNGSVKVRGDILSVEVDNFSPALISEFVPDFDIVGGVVGGTLLFSIDPSGEPRIRTTSPLELKAVKIESGHWGIIEPLTIDALMDLSTNQRTVQWDLQSLKILRNRSLLMKSRLTGNADLMDSGLIQTKGTVELYLKSLAALPAIKAFGLPRLPPDLLALSASFNLDYQDIELVLNGLSVGLHNAEGKPVLLFSNKQNLTLDLKGFSKEALMRQALLCKLTLDDLPLSWGNAYLGDVQFSRGILNGDLGIALNNEIVKILPQSNFEFNRVSLMSGGKKVLSNLDVSLTPTGEFDLKSRHFKVSNNLSSLRKGEALMKVNLLAEGVLADNNKPQINGALELNVDLPAFLEAYSVEGIKPLARGSLVASVKIKMDDTATITGDILLNEVKTMDRRKIPDISIGLQGEMNSDFSKIKVIAPIKIAMEGRESDVKLKAQIVTQGEGRPLSVSLKSESDKIFVWDMQRFNELFPVVNEPSRGRQTSAVNISERDAIPIWDGVLADVEMKIGTIYLPDAQRLDNSVLKLAVTESNVTVSELSSTIKGSQVDGKAQLAFDGNQRNPYAMNFGLSVSDFDPIIFEGKEKGEQGQVEGNFNLDVKSSGEFATLDSLGDWKCVADQLRAEVVLTGRSVSFRGIDPNDGARKRLLRMGSLAGMVSGNKDIAAISSVLTHLEGIDFDLVKLVIRKEKLAQIDIPELSVLGPEIYLSGTGEIQGGSWFNLKNYPSSFQLNLGAKSRLAQDLNALSMLSGVQNEEKYYLLVDSPLKLRVSLKNLKKELLAYFTDKIMSKATSSIQNQLPVGDILNGFLGPKKTEQNLDDQQQQKQDTPTTEDLLKKGVEQGVNQLLNRFF